MIDKAQALHIQGRLDEAEQIYRQILNAHPDELRSLEGLGVLLFQRGRAAEAVPFLERGVGLRPDLPRFRANLGEALRVVGRRAEACEHLRETLRVEPAFAQAWNSLGLLAHEEKRFADSESACRQAIKSDPRFVAAYINLGNALQSLRRPAEAALALRQALAIDQQNMLALTNLASILSELGDADLLPEAEALCRRAESLAPEHPLPPEILGNVLRARGRPEEALAAYKRSLARDRRRAMPCHHIGKLLEQQDRLDEAGRLYHAAVLAEPRNALFRADLGSLAAARGELANAERHFRQAIALEPESLEARSGLGIALLEQGRIDEAERYFREILELAPSSAAAWMSLAQLQAEIGDLEASCQSARAALAILPRMAEAYAHLANHLKDRLPDADVTAIEQLLDSPNLPDGNRASLHFGMGAILDARGLHDRASQAFDVANALRASARAAFETRYDPAKHTELTDAIRGTFTPEFLAARRGWGDPDYRPVFVVGLPRSGTTLVEQILASHPSVHGAGELNDVQQIFQTLSGHGLPAREALQALGSQPAETIRSAADHYARRLDNLAPASALRVVDKMPDNIRFAGLIAMLWPNSRVIVCIRDLRDVALSCRQTDFRSIRWTNDWKHMARRFVDYCQLLDHWRQAHPVSWLELRYEDLVTDFEPNARRLIEFLELDWDANCLDFHATRRPVRTASLFQVRRPVYSRSVGRYRNYRSMLEPLFEALRELGHDIDELNRRALALSARE
jgi:tetratricopeptide (TPR) repeat protein